MLKKVLTDEGAHLAEFLKCTSKNMYRAANKIQQVNRMWKDFGGGQNLFMQYPNSNSNYMYLTIHPHNRGKSPSHTRKEVPKKDNEEWWLQQNDYRPSHMMLIITAAALMPVLDLDAMQVCCPTLHSGLGLLTTWLPPWVGPPLATETLLQNVLGCLPLQAEHLCVQTCNYRSCIDALQ